MKDTSKFLLLTFAITASVGSINHANAESLGSVSHIHHVKVVGKQSACFNSRGSL